MSILARGLLTTNELVTYVQKKHNRHWNRGHISNLVASEWLIPGKLGNQNIFYTKDVDSYIGSLRRISSSGRKGVCCKI